MGAWQRYWEAMTQLHIMYSKWSDAFTQCVAFVNVSVMQLQEAGGEMCDMKVARLEYILGKIQRNFGLMSALAAHRVSHGDVQRMAKRCEMASWNDQIIMRRALRVGNDLTGATKLPGFVTFQHLETLTNENIDNTWLGHYTLTDVISAEERGLPAQSRDRVNLVMYWITHSLAFISKDLSVAPPIQSRMYHEISSGMEAFNLAVNISDTPFPFQLA